MHFNVDQSPLDLIRSVGALDGNSASVLAETLLPLLSHEDEDVREEVLRAIFVRGKLKRHREVLFDHARDDESVGVRCAALYGIAATSSASTLADDVAEAARIVQAHVEPPDVRGAAYDALLILHRRPAFPSMKAPFDAERDVDWAWFKQVTSTAGGGG